MEAMELEKEEEIKYQSNTSKALILYVRTAVHSVSRLPPTGIFY